MNPHRKPIAWERRGECFVCLSHLGKYPMIKIKGVKHPISRLILAHRGEQIESKEARHTCDNKRCIRPDHILIGTHWDNMNDLKRLGYGYMRRGDNHPCRKLTSDEVIEIRRRRATSFLKTLATEFGVSKSLISVICRNEIWKSVLTPKAI